ncbi:MAG TPA: hypothetical protein VHG30_14780 [Microvirga sp.]|nr:hypothetical protein [Microvirga sp.]
MTVRRPPSRLAAIGACVATAVLGLWLARGSTAEAWFFLFIAAAGLTTGSLGLLMIGHLLSEEWLTPVRSEAEAAALTAPLLLALALPLAVSLDALYPWAGARLALPAARAAYLSPAFFLARGVFYLLVWTALAVWITRTSRLRRASAVGLAILAPTATFAANDWVLSREPLWWSSLFGFSFALSQLLAALAGAILVSLLRPEHPSAVRMKSLERALVTLALLVFWAWFAQFLIVWLGDLPNEVAWYLARSGAWLWPLLGIALPTLALAVVILVPPGFGRRTMIVGSALLLLHHVGHMIWLLAPAARTWPLTAADGLVALAIAALWAAWFAKVLRGRPTFEAERGGS